MKVDWVKQLGVKITTLSEAAKIIKSTDDYYVYVIWKIYTPSPVPFYVGKGHWQRLIKHEMESEAENNIYKTRIIKKHKSLGVECGYTIIDFFDDESAALQAEIDLIALIGRFDLQLGPLANRTDGGDGTRGHLARKRGDSYSAKSVVANGERYGCLRDASEDLGVTSGAVSGRIKNGWSGYYYEDEGQRQSTKEILGRYKKEVVVLGNRYPSASEASRKLGIDVRMISKRIAYGWEGYYYVGEGQLPRKTVWSNRKDKVAVTIFGKSYSTVAEAVLATGESWPKISKRCLSPNFPGYSRNDGLIVPKLSPPKNPEAVLVNAKRFESIGKAAECFGITDGGVAYRCRSDNYPNWMFADAFKQATESFTPGFSSNPLSVWVDGVFYESQSKAAAAYEIDINTLKKRCRSYSFPGWVSTGVAKLEPKDGRPGLIGVVIDGKHYRSINQASRFLALPRKLIRDRLDSEYWPTYTSDSLALYR